MRCCAQGFPGAASRPWRKLKGVGSEYRIDEIEIGGATLRSVRHKFEQADMAALWKKQGK